MKAVILAAGRGTRMGALTANMPKVMLEVSGKTLIEFKLDILPNEIDEIILVVGYLGDMIRKRLGSSYKGKKILYAEQGSKHGTAGALWSAREVLHGRFIVMMGDDLYGKEDVKRACKSNTWLMFAKNAKPPHSGGKIIIRNGKIEEIIESGRHETPGLVSTNLFALDDRVFQYEMVRKDLTSEEYGLPQTVLAASKTSGIPLQLVQTSSGMQITSPEDLKKAKKILKDLDRKP